VFFHTEGRTVEGWSLNISAGGLRAILDEQVELGQTFEITLGEASEQRPGQVVWIQDEPDGAIVGVQFLDVPASTDHPSGEEAPPTSHARISKPGPDEHD
jgi:hypothetical protein